MKYLILLIACFQCYSAEILFYLQDAGETNALLPVAEKLIEEGIDVEILLGGLAQSIVKDKGTPISAFGIPVEPNWTRTDHLPEEVIQTIAIHYRPKVFISGVAFAVEGQLYDAFNSRGVNTIAFWDNFSAQGEDLYFSVARQVQEKAKALWVPTAQVAAAMAARSSVTVVGHPSLQKWAREANRVDKQAIRDRLDLSSDERVAVFVGGYGPLYEAAFKLFLDFASQVDDLTIFIQPHPKFGGTFELAKLSNNEKRPIRVLKNEVSTIEAVAMADFVFCHQSTVGFQAQFIGKPVTYFIPYEQQAPSFALNRVASSHDFNQALENKKGQTDFSLPLNSDSLCVKLLNKYRE